MKTYKDLLLDDFGIVYFRSEIRAKWFYNRLVRAMHRDSVSYKLK